MLNTKLHDRVLWFDGQVSVEPENLLSLLHKCASKLHVTRITSDIAQYNRNVSRDNKLTIKTEVSELDTSWRLPVEYMKMDVLAYVADVHAVLVEGTSDAELRDREIRLAQELCMYVEYGLIDVLRAIIYVINTLHSNDVVWGVGRGSSVASYVLYVIGVHDIDSHAYDLDITEFLHV